MKMCGYDVTPGAKVWHLLLGEGVVTEITPEGSARVSFGNASYTFGDSRRLAGERQTTLYWQNPVLIDPPPFADAPAWRDFVGAMCAMWDRMKGWVK
jgi:hypothetical protein